MKRLVVCLDGTWNSADNGDCETNVARLARAVSAGSLGEGTPQLTLYLRGVGTTGSLIDRVIDGVTGDGVDENIRSAYMFIAQNYVPGDGIFIFGFSRGAFTARSLCGLIGSVGLLKRRSLHRIADAWAYYRHGGDRSAQDFCRAYPQAECHKTVHIDFLGVWDTVGALGVPGGLGVLTPDFQFHDTSPSADVLRARHAMAIDEHRDEFVPTFWTVDPDAPDAHKHLDIQQVWFAGAHADVGGGYVPDGLASVPLVWMARESSRPITGRDGTTRPGLVLDWKEVLPPAPDPGSPQHESRQSVYWKDRFTPTYRRICQINREIGLLGRLYVPSVHGTELRTINESVHPAVWERYRRKVTLIDGSDRSTMIYRPPNLPPKRSVSTWAPPADREATGPEI